MVPNSVLLLLVMVREILDEFFAIFSTQKMKNVFPLSTKPSFLCFLLSILYFFPVSKDCLYLESNSFHSYGRKVYTKENSSSASTIVPKLRRWPRRFNLDRVLTVSIDCLFLPWTIYSNPFKMARGEGKTLKRLFRRRSK